MDLQSVGSRVLLQSESTPQVWNSGPDVFTNETVNRITVPYNLYETVAIATICAIMSLTTIVGNVLVVVAFKIEKQLQTVSNYFLLSLAVADLAIGAISMPFFTLYLLYGYKWPLGATLCDCWLAIDYTMSNASVANLLIISFDRYFSVSRPLTYRAKRTPKRAAIMIGCAWTISILLWTPWIFSWPHIEGQRTVPPNECYIQFLKTNSYVTILTAILAFYLPVSIMTFLYYKIWRATEERKKWLINLTAADRQQNSKRSNSSEEESFGTSTNQQWGASSPDVSEIDPFIEEFDNQSEEHKTKWTKVLKRCCLGDRKMDYIDNSRNADFATSTALCQDFSRNDLAEPSSRSAIYASSLTDPPRMNSQGGHFENEDVCENRQLDSKKGNYEMGAMFLSAINQNSRKDSVKPSPNSVKTNSQTIYSDNDILPHDLQKSQTMAMDISDVQPNSLESEGDIFYSLKEDSIYLKIPKEGSLEQLNFQLVEERNSEKMKPVTENDGKDDNSEKGKNSNESSPEGTFRSPKHKSHKARKQILKTQSTNQNGIEISSPVTKSRKRTPTLDLVPISRNTKISRWAADRTRNQQAKRKQNYQEKKAAKILSAILLVFIITWSPYNFFTVFQVFCENCINDTVYAIGYSLCYLNSTINPLCYALCNVNFRTTFLRILLCRTKRHVAHHRTVLLQRHRRLNQLGSPSTSFQRTTTEIVDTRSPEPENGKK